MSVREKAELMVASVRQALENGCRHYDPETGALLSDPRAILVCLRDKGQVTIQEPRRCPCGHREYEDSQVLCPTCGVGLPTTGARP